ncbi:MAG: transcriptional regulator [Nitrosopumilales archaeon]|nr:MAG: transcriptional regulator [Nitrosopumilales archaeon]
MFERFKKNRDKLNEFSSENEPEGSVMIEDIHHEPQKAESPEFEHKAVEQVKIPESIEQFNMSQPTEDIGIRSLMDKRTKLEEAIDYVGLLIKNLKDKRTKLEKSIEDESVDIKNLKEKLLKVGQYIDEERHGIKVLQQKRTDVEKEADDVGVIINNLREKLMSIDSIVNEEGSKIEKFKESRPKSESSL